MRNRALAVGALAAVCAVGLSGAAPDLALDGGAGSSGGAGDLRGTAAVADVERPSFAGSAGLRFAAGRLLVAPAAGASAADLRAVHERVGARVEEMLPAGGVRRLRLPPGLSVADAAARYERADAVRFAEPDYLLRPSLAGPMLPNDPDFRSLWGLHNTGQTGGVADADIDAPQAWSTTTGDPDTVVAVIDTGVDITHADLADNVWTNTDEVPGNRVDDDNNGYVDDVHGWDFYHGDNTVVDGSDDDHGTHVAGTIAAVGGNGTGVAGVAWRAQVMPLKFLGPQGGYTSDAIAALDYAVANGARVSNNSWGGGAASRALQEAITRAGQAGHLFIAAAGNGGGDGIGDDNDTQPNYPAAYPHSSIISVAATDHTDSLARFSNFGSVSVDLGAPGVGITSTLPGNAYGRFNGTSMATPHVTGAVALLLASRPDLDVATLKQRLLTSTNPVATLEGRTSTGGRLNVATALGARATPTLTLGTDPASLRFGTATTVSGRLAADGQPLAGRALLLQRRPAGTTRWRLVSRDLRTGDDGGFRHGGLQPDQNTDYRVRLPSDGPDQPAARSPVRRVNVRVRVSLSTRTTDLRLGRSRTISGQVTPAHTGTVRTIISRNGSVIARKMLRLNDSRYRFTYTPRRRGTYGFGTVRFADTDHLGTRSATRSFDVVR